MRGVFPSRARPGYRRFCAPMARLVSTEMVIL